MISFFYISSYFGLHIWYPDFPLPGSRQMVSKFTMKLLSVKVLNMPSSFMTKDIFWPQFQLCHMRLGNTTRVFHIANVKSTGTCTLGCRKSISCHIRNSGFPAISDVIVCDNCFHHVFAFVLTDVFLCLSSEVMLFILMPCV